MLLGLGTGSTAAYFIDALGERVRSGLHITAVATSRATETQAAAYGIPVVDTIDRDIDLTVDGADEVDTQLNLIKGLGGALLREKVVAAASRRMMVIATEDKLVPHLGRGVLPVEVLPLLWERTAAAVRKLDLQAVLRIVDGVPFVSDNGNLILDCRLQPPRDLEELAARLEGIPGSSATASSWEWRPKPQSPALTASGLSAQARSWRRAPCGAPASSVPRRRAPLSGPGCRPSSPSLPLRLWSWRRNRSAMGRARSGSG